MPWVSFCLTSGKTHTCTYNLVSCREESCTPAQGHRSVKSQPLPNQGELHRELCSNSGILAAAVLSQVLGVCGTGTGNRGSKIIIPKKEKA